MLSATDRRLLFISGRNALRTTIKDIAKETGLSITTVSLVLNDKGKNISPEHRKLVVAVAERLNYRPNQLAVGLVTKKTNTIGLIIPDIMNMFFSELTKGIEDQGRQEGYNVILCDSNDLHNLELQYINILADRSVDGIIVAMSAESYSEKGAESLEALKKCGVPAIIVDCFCEVSDFSTVAIDNFTGAYLAAEYLLSIGHRKIACVTGPLGPKTNADRLEGYVKALNDHSVDYDKSLVYEGDFHYQSGYDAVGVLLRENPTAILCQNDMMAYGAIKALRERKLRIPDDISVMGFDDIFFSEIMDIPLSTVEQPVYRMGKQAARILQGEIDCKTLEKQHVLFEPTLKIRKSTKALNEMR